MTHRFSHRLNALSYQPKQGKHMQIAIVKPTHPVILLRGEGSVPEIDN